MKITVIGAYGCGNIGDEALLEGMISKIHSIHKEADITVFAADFKYIEKLFPVNTISQVLTEGISWNVIRRFHFLGIIRSLIKSDKVIIGGGSLIHDRTWYNLVYYVFLALIAIMTGAKVHIVGVSVAQIRTRLGKWMARLLLQWSQSIMVRDEISYQHVLQLAPKTKLTLSWDLAFMNLESTLSQHMDMKIDLPEKFIAMNIFGWFHSDDYWKQDNNLRQARMTKIAELADTIIDKYRIPLVFVNTVIPLDSNAASEIRTMMKHANSSIVLDQLLSPYQMKNIVQQADVVIGMRLHAIIFATIVATPFLALIYDEKVRAFIDRIHLPEYCTMEMDSLNQVDTIADNLDLVMHNKEQITEQLFQAREYFHGQLKEQLWDF